jgi:hypothetical protein
MIENFSSSIMEIAEKVANELQAGMVEKICLSGEERVCYRRTKFPPVLKREDPT